MKIKFAGALAIGIVGIAAFIFLKTPAVNFSDDAKTGLHFHRSGFDEALKQAATTHKLVFLDIYATWCGPCKKLTPILEDKAKGAKGAWKLVKFDIDEVPELATALKVNMHPWKFLINHLDLYM